VTWTWRLRRTFLNPLVMKDGLSRARTWRTPAVIALYLALLGLFACLVFTLQLGAVHRTWGLAQVGSAVFTTLAVVQLTLVCLFAPAVAAGAISGERERQTLDVLMVSCVSPLSLVWGKLVASIAFILLLVAAALPLFATVFLFGGIDLGQFVIAQLLTVTTALAIGAASLFLSAVFRRTLVSTVMAYGAAFAGIVGTWIVGIYLTQLAYLQTRGPVGGPADVHPLMVVNPFQALVVLLLVPGGAPMRVGRALQLFFLAGGPPSTAGPALEPWQASMLVELVVVGLSVLGAVLVLRGRRPLPWPAAD
jgi:ABC-2 type transport system permease protein